MTITDHFVPVIVDDLDSAIVAYETQLGVPAAKRWAFEAMGLELCVVRPFVLFTVPAEMKGEISKLRAVLYVDDINGVRKRMAMANLVIKWDVDTPVGPAIYVQHSDDMMVEYIQPRDGWVI